jgi:RNase adaptor protein for sRNA GlmZ degradation
MVSFGCTGGQHRSVYFAEQLAQRLRGHSGVDVVLRHVQLERLGMDKMHAENAGQ